MSITYVVIPGAAHRDTRRDVGGLQGLPVRGVPAAQLRPERGAGRAGVAAPRARRPTSSRRSRCSSSSVSAMHSSAWPPSGGRASCARTTRTPTRYPCDLPCTGGRSTTGPAAMPLGAAHRSGLVVACWATGDLQSTLPRSPSGASCSSPAAGGWLTAVGGAWKDAPVEGFSGWKFLRSPAVATLWAIVLCRFTGDWVLLAVAAAGLVGDLHRDLQDLPDRWPAAREVRGQADASRGRRPARTVASSCTCGVYLCLASVGRHDGSLRHRGVASASMLSLVVAHRGRSNDLGPRRTAAIRAPHRRTA